MNAKRMTSADRRASAFYEAIRLLTRDGIDPTTAPAHLWFNALDFADRSGDLPAPAWNWYMNLNNRQWTLFRGDVHRWQTQGE